MLNCVSMLLFIKLEIRVDRKLSLPLETMCLRMTHRKTGANLVYAPMRRVIRGGRGSKASVIRVSSGGEGVKNG